jgi:hypothetical protein
MPLEPLALLAAGFPVFMKRFAFERKS